MDTKKLNVSSKLSFFFVAITYNRYIIDRAVYFLFERRNNREQAEKRKISYDLILQAAIKEFGNKNYDLGSLSSICEDNTHISKGLIYHYFKNKDDLYLHVASYVFKEVAELLNKSINDFNSMEECLIGYLKVRDDYFKIHKEIESIFFELILNPNLKLLDKINEVRAPFKKVNLDYYKKALSFVKLKDGVTLDMAVSYCQLIQDGLNLSYRQSMRSSNDFNSIRVKHEESIKQTFHYLLNGLVEEIK